MRSGVQLLSSLKAMAESEDMSYVYDYNYIVNNTIRDNHTPYVVDPNTLSCELKPLATIPALTLCVILITIFLLAIPGNLLVGWVISSSRKALTPSDVYLFHLTIADGLMALTLPFLAVDLIKGWIFGDFLCKFLNLAIEANFYTSILFLACISIDRYLVIVRASENLSTQPRMFSKLMCAAVWALGWALALPALFNETSSDPDSMRMICQETYDMGSAATWRNATRGFRHIFGFLLPLYVMIICYGVTIARLLHTRSFKKHRAMKVIIAVLVTFLLCWTPYHITMIVDTLLRTDLILFDCALRSSVTRALLITKVLALFHSCINPVLYAFVGEKFRNKMMLLLHRKGRPERMSKSCSTSQTSEGNSLRF